MLRALYHFFIFQSMDYDKLNDIFFDFFCDKKSEVLRGLRGF